MQMLYKLFIAFTISLLLYQYIHIYIYTYIYTSTLQPIIYMPIHLFFMRMDILYIHVYTYIYIYGLFADKNK